MNKDLTTILRTSVPLFRGFPPDEIRALLSICRMRSFQAGDLLMQSGSPSTEMYLILSGEVLVRTSNGVPLARLSRSESVGEMGIFTGETRSATVEVQKEGTFVVISRSGLLRVLAKKPAMAVRMYKNVVEILSARLRNENLQIQMYRDRVQELETKLSSSAHPPEAEDAPGRVPPAEVSDVPLDEAKIIEDFYHSIGAPDVSSEQHGQDRTTYQALREQGYSDAQIQQAANWTAKNIHGVKEFALVKYTIEEAFKKS